MTKEEFDKLMSSCELHEQYDLFTGYIKQLEAENARLRARVAELEEIKNKYYCLINQALNSTQPED